MGIYVHLPFCAKKCSYCDFLSFDDMNDYNTQFSYTKALLEEIGFWKQQITNTHSVDTIFIGGGTPSVFDLNLLENILSTLHSAFDINSGAEVTIESNPGSLTAHKLKTYKGLGINRLSMGVQSLESSVLNTLGRIHDAEDVFGSIKEARNAGFENINIDLMFGVPGQEEESWCKTLKGVLKQEPEHVSFYGLQLEEGTPLHQRVNRNEILLPDWKTDRQMYRKAIEILDSEGYRHYEISNSAKSGFECRHNLGYWSMKEYLGIGLGSHSYLKYVNNFVRFNNTENIKEYLSNINGYHFPKPYHNTIDDDMAEYIIMGLRRISGISTLDFNERFSVNFMDLYRRQVYTHCQAKLLKYDELTGQLVLTPDGIDVSNKILADFV